MSADSTQALSGAQTLVYGGLISLSTAVVLLLIQTFLQGRRERFLERRAAREHFFAYDLEKFKQFEKLLLDYKHSAQEGVLPNDAFMQLSDFMMMASPSFTVQLRMIEVLGEMTPPTGRLINAYHAVKKKHPSIILAAMPTDENYNEALVALQHATINVIKAYRVEILGEDRKTFGLRGDARLR